MCGKGMILMFKEHRYIIGIDLGTTNSAVSFVNLEAVSSGETSKKKLIKTFQVPQLTGAGEISRLKVLPSFLYVPGEYDISSDAVIHPFKTGEKKFAGTFARDHGAKVPARLVSSAKSWLCHDKVDRKAPILPWGAPDSVKRVSPVEATAAYLDHVRRSWNRVHREDEERFMEHQKVVITVPASFDEVARELTLESAKLAGLGDVTLLEEPLAAFYSWLILHEKDWADFVKPGDLILVCDVGGGTTDVTLITLREADGSPRFERIAVGDHLILGGDNIDLALARQVEAGFPNKIKFTGERWKMLCHQCRKAKESILSGEKSVERIVLRGEGRSLIDGTVSAKLTREMVESIVLDGFFPIVTQADSTRKKKRKGISEFGLPYEQEPAMTRHIGWFLQTHKKTVTSLLGKDKTPELILFNGGSLKPAIITDRIRQGVRTWFDETDEALPRVLENPDPDTAVALGASYYGMVKLGIGVKVGSGSARGYYLGVETKDKDKTAVCLVERGMDEGNCVSLSDKNLKVITNRPVAFDLYSSSFRSGDKTGDVIELDDTLTQLPPMNTVIQYGKKGVETELPVQMEADYTETGALVIRCASMVSDHKWTLNFQLRSGETKRPVSEGEVFEETMVNEARTAVKDAFEHTVNRGNKGNTPVTAIVKTVTKIVDRPKIQWPLSFIRSLTDELLNQTDNRTKTPEFEARWLNFTGYALRPGNGHAMDPQRVKKIWNLFRHGPAFTKNPQVRKEWWILYRRIAAGLTPGQQRQFFQELSPILFSKKVKSAKIAPQERIEIWMALANMERLLVKDKIKCGDALIKEFTSGKTPDQYFWAISRIGAREPLYGSIDRLVGPQVAGKWIRKITKGKWKNPKSAGNALVQLARKTGDITRDVDEIVVAAITRYMEKNNLPRKLITPVNEVVQITREDESDLFGESLPAGIVLRE